MTINYGVIGSGYFGAAQARVLNQIPGANVMGIYDPHNAEGPAKEVGAKVYEKWMI